jgi:hypothetical protein
MKIFKEIICVATTRNVKIIKTLLAEDPMNFHLNVIY